MYKCLRKNFIANSEILPDHELKERYKKNGTLKENHRRLISSSIVNYFKANKVHLKVKDFRRSGYSNKDCIE